MVRSKYGPLVGELDPSGSLLDAWEVGDAPDGLDRFADIALTAVIGTVGVVKLQAAFFGRHGRRGFRTAAAAGRPRPVAPACRPRWATHRPVGPP